MRCRARERTFGHNEVNTDVRHSIIQSGDARTAIGPAGWRPVLTSSAASDACGVAAEIADAIENRRDVGWGGGLGGGAVGFALLNAYLAVVSDDPTADERAVRWLSRGIDQLGPGVGMSLYSGGAGIAWVGEHVSKLLSREPVDPDEAMERRLLRTLSRGPWRSHVELISGLAGYGLLALERLPRAGARECLEQVIMRLDELAERTEHGITWRTPAELLVPWERAEAPDGYYNLGVAHGVPGVLAMLALSAAAGVAQRRARALADGAAEWLLSQRLPEDEASVFQYWIAPGQDPTPARLGWCYGDLGVAATLLVAARALGVGYLEGEALALARRAAARSPDACGVEDACLCHGAAGLGHLFNRMHQATGDPALATAARYWLERTLAMRHSGAEGYAGFCRMSSEQTGGDGAGLITGAAGVALALLAAGSDIEPAWDRLLLASPVNAGW
jgi:hypothetical protein